MFDITFTLYILFLIIIELLSEAQNSYMLSTYLVLPVFLFSCGTICSKSIVARYLASNKVSISSSARLAVDEEESNDRNKTKFA